MCLYKEIITGGSLESSAIRRQVASMAGDAIPLPCLLCPRHEKALGDMTGSRTSKPQSLLLVKVGVNLRHLTLSRTSETPLLTELRLQKRPALHTLTQTRRAHNLQKQTAFGGIQGQ